MSKEVRVSVRVTPELKARLHRAEEVTGLPETQVVIRSLEAYCDYVEKHGEFTVPFIVLPKRSQLPPPAILPAPFGEDQAKWQQEALEQQERDLAAESPPPPYGASIGKKVTANATRAAGKAFDALEKRAAPSPAPVPPPAGPASNTSPSR